MQLSYIYISCGYIKVMVPKMLIKINPQKLMIEMETNKVRIKSEQNKITTFHPNSSLFNRALTIYYYMIVDAVISALIRFCHVYDGTFRYSVITTTCSRWSVGCLDRSFIGLTKMFAITFAKNSNLMSSSRTTLKYQSSILTTL